VTELLIVIEGQVAGHVRAGQGGRLSLEYETDWLASAGAHSLSLSMPRAHVAYPQKLVLPYLWNLLPENPNVLQRWAQRYHVSAASPLKLLVHVGADVPGAAQLVPPERLEEIRSQRRPTIDWITTDDLTEHF
jgi:serine/threonine-protein kinase HipA